MQNLVETETKNLQKISKTLVEQEGRKTSLDEQIPALQKVNTHVSHTMPSAWLPAWSVPYVVQHQLCICAWFQCLLIT